MKYKIIYCQTLLCGFYEFVCIVNNGNVQMLFM